MQADGWPSSCEDKMDAFNNDDKECWILRHKLLIEQRLAVIFFEITFRLDYVIIKIIILQIYVL